MLAFTHALTTHTQHVSTDTLTSTHLPEETPRLYSVGWLQSQHGSIASLSRQCPQLIIPQRAPQYCVGKEMEQQSLSNAQSGGVDNGD